MKLSDKQKIKLNAISSTIGVIGLFFGFIWLIDSYEKIVLGTICIITAILVVSFVVYQLYIGFKDFFS